MAGGREVLGGITTLARLLPRVSRPLSALLALLLVGPLVLTVADLLVSGRVIGQVPAAIEDGMSSAAGRDLVRSLLLLTGLAVVQVVLSLTLGSLSDVLGRRTNQHLRDRVVAAAGGGVGISHLEDPEILDTMSLARNVTPGFLTPGAAAAAVGPVLAQKLPMLPAAVVIATWNAPLAVAGLVLGVLHQSGLWRILFDNSSAMQGGADLRRATWWRDLAVTPDAAKEVRMFGLGHWIGLRFAGEWVEAITNASAVRSKAWRPFIVVSLLRASTLGIALVLLIDDAIDGTVSLTRLGVLLPALAISQTMGASHLDLQLAFGAGAVPAVLDLERRVTGRDEHLVMRASHAVEVPRVERAIRFESVSFSYPGATRPVYEGLDLELRAGESVAIVGSNGAGKTTLVKLLGRLYEPTAGRITVDGVDLRDLDPAVWRSQLAVLFQDFLRWQLPAADNVGFGHLALADDRAALDRVAARAGALELVESLPLGWDTVLSRTVTDGRDLSGGQWQRIALARALLAVEGGSKVLVLDEPTANLDVRAEAALYDEFLEITRGLTTVLISHRFSTVRRADRIVVVEHGRVTEDGDHTSLLAHDGTYARMFRAQASRFTGDADTADTADSEVPGA